MDTLSTPQQHETIRQAAQERVGFILWLAEKLEVTADLLIRQEAARVLRQLVEGK
jgi:hypothetical protein